MHWGNTVWSMTGMSNVRVDMYGAAEHDAECRTREHTQKAIRMKQQAGRAGRLAKLCKTVKPSAILSGHYK